MSRIDDIVSKHIGKIDQLPDYTIPRPYMKRIISQKERIVNIEKDKDKRERTIQRRKYMRDYYLKNIDKITQYKKDRKKRMEEKQINIAAT
jgi:hypothetical protein